jgi:hypothetical protein
MKKNKKLLKETARIKLVLLDKSRLKKIERIIAGDFDEDADLPLTLKLYKDKFEGNQIDILNWEDEVLNSYYPQDEEYKDILDILPEARFLWENNKKMIYKKRFLKESDRD